MDLEQIESQRKHLEEQVASLRDSLKHWQTLDAEYEGVKEALQANSKLDEATIFELGRDYEGSLVKEDDIHELSGLKSGALRTRQQISDAVDHRLQYVSKNIDTLSRQYYAAEGKLEEFDFAAASASGADPRFADEAQGDSPLIEIHEELDDDDNVVKSELRRPDLETQTILDNINLQRHKDKKEEQPAKPVQRPPVRKKSVSFSADTKAAHPQPTTETSDGKKSVSFAPKVAIAPAAALPDNRSVSFAPAVVEIPAAQPVPPVLSTEVQDQLRSSFKPGDTVYELNDDEQPAVRHVILPENESIDDAEMRRQMLNYHLNEVGSVVASMDLDDGYNDDHSDFASSENLDDIDTPYTTGTSDEDEDEFGRQKSSGISDEYRSRMAALSARLLRSQVDPATDKSETQSSNVHTLAIRGGQANAEAKEKANSKKRVSFAEVLDVATANDAPPLKAQKGVVHSPHPIKSIDALAATEPEDSSDEDEGPIVADTLVERAPQQTPAMPPSAEDADLLMSKRELASEYYRRRNDMLKEQGGFKKSDDEEPLYEERDGKMKKVSRFKAARLHD